MISFVIVNYMNFSVTEECISSIKKNVNENCEIIVVDNASPNNCVEYLTEKYINDPLVKIIANDKNYGFGTANNIGAKLAKGEIIYFVNSDVLFEDFDFASFSDILRKNPKIGMLSCKILFKDGSVQSVGNSMPTYRSLFCENILFCNSKKSKNRRYRNYSNRGLSSCVWCSGSFFACRKDNYFDIGGFDENIFLYGEDLELGINFVKHGYVNKVDDTYYVYHLHGSSTKGSGISYNQIMKRKLNDLYVFNKYQLFKYELPIKVMFSFYSLVIVLRARLIKK